MTRFEKGQRVTLYGRAGTVHLADDLVVLVRWDGGEWDAIAEQDDLNRLQILPTFDERWINVHAPGTGNYGYKSRAEADDNADSTRLGVIHLADDGTLTMETP